MISETETFSYDYLDRLTSAATNSGTNPYIESYVYDLIGNLLSKNGTNYTYGVKPHAVTQVGSASYVYDANGNLTTRDTQTLTWDVENRVSSVSGGASFVYDGDGNRVKKTEGGQTTVYIGKYYEKNVTSGEITTHYYLGSQQVAVRKGTTLSYLQQDSLSSTSVISNASGSSIGTLKYFSFGAIRTNSGTLPTDKKFTGQRLDGTGLYYYNARYYDPNIGRFISPDIYIQDPTNPQAFNRYSYCVNNPLRYTDPSGWWTFGLGLNLTLSLFALSIDLSGGFTFDNHGGMAFQGRKAAGGMLSVGTASLDAQIQCTAADNINELRGSTKEIGGSTEIPNFFIFGLGGNLGGDMIIDEKGTLGVNINIGAGVSAGPGELHYTIGQNYVTILRQPNSPVSTNAPSPSRPTVEFSATSSQCQQLNDFGISRDSSAYNAMIDQSCNNVLANLGSNQVLSWSSELGYHAIDINSQEYQDCLYY